MRLPGAAELGGAETIREQSGAAMRWWPAVRTWRMRLNTGVRDTAQTQHRQSRKSETRMFPHQKDE